MGGKYGIIINFFKEARIEFSVNVKMHCKMNIWEIVFYINSNKETN